MKPSFKRLASSVSAALLLVVAIVVFFNFIVPLYHDIAVVRAEEASRAELLSNQKQVVSQVRALIASYEEGAQIQEVVSAALPLAPETAQAILQLGGIAQANNLSPRSFTVAGGADSQATPKNDVKSAASIVKTVGTIAIRMELTGTYEDFRNFIKNLDTNIRIFDLRDASIRPVGKPNQNLYAYDLTVAAYYQAQ